ncbi:MAG: FAD synthetase family protein [Chlamydiota bacterium]|nr:FAD synthetase family protein [Chlamydiota bacterium]
MSTYFNLHELEAKAYKPVVLTLGMFDGVHRGHQKVIQTAKKMALDKATELLAVTFKSHPIKILKPETDVFHISPFRQKVELLHEYGVDKILALEFTLELSKRTAFEFLNMIYKKQPFTDLVIGYDGTIGSDQENNREKVEAACKKLNVNVVYVDAEEADGRPISSRRIRRLINEGRSEDAKLLLGR